MESNNLLICDENEINGSYEDELNEEILNKFYLAIADDEILNNSQSFKGLTGLRNLGNTCYMNAALQALSNCPPLREYFCSFLTMSNLSLNDFSSGDSSSLELNCTGQVLRPLSVAFKDIINRLWSNNEYNSITPTFFLYKLREKCIQFRGFNQQDAQEFIRCFLDALHQELRRPVKVWEIEMLNDSKNFEHDIQKSSKNFVENISKSNISTNNSEEDKTENDDTPKSRNKNFAHQNNEKKSPYFEVNEKEKIINYKSIITDVFDGELVSSVRCQTCQHISYTKENFQDLSLSIPSAEQLEYLRDASLSTSNEQMSTTSEKSSSEPNNLVNKIGTWFYSLVNRWFFRFWYNWFVYFYRYMFAGSISLEDCLKAFFSTDFLHGEDMYSCEKCRKLRNGVKQCKLIRLPEILCIHLKRFRHDNLYNSKINTKITFPLNDLDMSPFIRESTLENDVNLITEYDLVAIISHRGSGIEYGHYVAYCRNEFDKNWYEFDDSVVTRVNTLEVMNKESYVLFYQKKTSSSTNEYRRKCKKLFCKFIKERSYENVNVDLFYISKEWFHKFLTFSEPGPINNADFLCSHGQMLPSFKKLHADDQYSFPYMLLSGSVWSFLKHRFGGGPTYVDLKECNICQQALDKFLERKRYERKAFVKYKSKTLCSDYL